MPTKEHAGKGAGDAPADNSAPTADDAAGGGAPEPRPAFVVHAGANVDLLRGPAGVDLLRRLARVRHVIMFAPPGAGMSAGLMLKGQEPPEGRSEDEWLPKGCGAPTCAK